MPIAGRERRAVFPPAVAEAAARDLVAPAGATGADAAASPARREAAVELLALGVVRTGERRARPSGCCRLAAQLGHALRWRPAAGSGLRRRQAALGLVRRPT